MFSAQGQALVEKDGYVPITADFAAEELKKSRPLSRLFSLYRKLKSECPLRTCPSILFFQQIGMQQLIII